MALKPPPHLSPSSIATFRQCPLRFKFNKIDGMREPDTEATIMGNFVHEILEVVFKLEPETRTINAAKEIASSLWNHGQWKEKVSEVIGPNEVKLREFRWKSWWCLENYFAIEDPSSIKPSGIEHEVNDTIAGVQIKGFIDRWSENEDGLVISDYKTGKTPAPKYRADKFVQLLIYAILLEQETEKPAKKLELLYLKDGTVLSSDVDRKKVDSVKDMITTVHEGIMDRCEKEYFEPKTSVLCGWCDFKNICPAWT
jgi:putative RecB family exonuclease